MVEGLYLNLDQVNFIDVITNRKMRENGQNYEISIFNGVDGFPAILVIDRQTDFTYSVRLDEIDPKRPDWEAIITRQLNEAFNYLGGMRSGVVAVN